MKILRFVVLCLALSAAGAYAQTSATASSQTDSDINNTAQVVEIGPNHRVWQWQTYETTPSGQIVAHDHKYTELASGLNYQNTNGEWLASQEQIQGYSGGAIARQGQHQVIFANNLNSAGAIDMQTPDSKRLRSNILGLMYVDVSSGQAVLIAQLKDSQGELVAANKVLYPDAFDGVKADVQYTYRRSGLEQDVILRERPPLPEAFGMDSATTEMEVFTEFLNPPSASVVEAGTDESDLEPDQSISWGETALGRGKAFSLSGVDSPASVSKRYVIISGRHFLLEKIMFHDIKPALTQLPKQASNARRLPGMASKNPILPKTPPIKTAGRPMRLALATPSAQGYVLDYVTLNSSFVGYTFRGDTTYYLSGAVTVSGTNTFEGGAVLKYATNGSLTAQSAANPLAINWQATPYRPVVFTAKDDNSIGETISGSTGSPTNYYANPALAINNLISSPVSNFRVSYARQALALNNSTTSFYDGQVINCLNGGTTSGGGNYYLRNILFSGVKTNFNGLYPASIDAQNCSFDSSSYLATMQNIPYISVWIYLTNCVFANVTALTNLYSYGGMGNFAVFAGNNGFYNTRMIGSGSLTNSYPPFQSAGAGKYYLATNSYFLNQGITNIDPVLLADLRRKTTYPPILLTNLVVSTNLTLCQQVQRDTDALDLGYHYVPLDYLVDKLAMTNASLNVSNGTAVACFNEPGIQLQNGSSLVSIGTPLQPNWFVRYQSAQEQSVQLGGTNVSAAQTVSSAGSGPAVFQFSKFACPAFGGYHLYDAATTTNSSLLVSDCEFWSGQNNFTGSTNTTATLMNNLFWRSTLTASNASLSSTLTLTNNLVYGAAVNLSQPAGTVWSALNNAFDLCTLTNCTLTNGYNAYLGCTGRLYPTNAQDLVRTTTLGYAPSWLGNFYLITNSPLINAGSATADQVGLYHFTTQTNQMKETNSTVDIGFHYVATDAYGNPLSTITNNAPDYLVDTNGNGLPDAWELNYFGNLNQTVANDYAGDGFGNLYKYLHGLNPTQFFTNQLGYWPFDNTNTWVNGQGQLPTVVQNVSGTFSWDTNAVKVDSAAAASLRYSCLGSIGGSANLTCGQGTIRLWFKPDWNSTNAGGVGPQSEGRLIEIGIRGSTNGWWALLIGSGGTNIYFATQTNAINSLITNNYASVSWKSNIWHQVVLTYSSNNSSIYVDGQPVVTNGIGVTNYPGVAVRSLGLAMGSDTTGSNQVQGSLDELETFNYPLSAAAIATNFQMRATWDGRGIGMPNLWQMNNFGYLGVDPNDNPAGDGISNLQKEQNNLDPHIFYPTRLGHWQFNDPPNWLDDLGLAPITTYGLYPVISWLGDAVKISPAQNSILTYPSIRANGSDVVICAAHTGTIRFWFKPDWTSAEGPNDEIRLFEIGEQSTNSAYGWFCLWANSLGTALTLSTEANGIHSDNAVWNGSFTTNAWYQVGFTYTPSNSVVYVDGSAVSTNGIGVTNLPNLATLTQGFRLGCSWDGVHQAGGVFDELETFNYSLSASDMASNYQATMNVDTYGTGLSDVVKNAYGLNPAAVDSDCEGLPDAWKIAHGLNPNDPTVATPANIALYVEGRKSGTTNVVNFAQSNLFNIFFSSFANNYYDTPIAGSAVSAGSNDFWNFFNMQSDYTNNGVPLLNAAGNSSGARLFAYVGPCRTVYAVPPTINDWDQSDPPDLTYEYYFSNNPPGAGNPGTPLFTYYISMTFNLFYNPWNSGLYGLRHSFWLRFAPSCILLPHWWPVTTDPVWDNINFGINDIYLFSSSVFTGSFVSSQPPSVVIPMLEALNNKPAFIPDWGPFGVGTWGDVNVGYFTPNSVASQAASSVMQANSYLANLSSFILRTPYLTSSIPTVLPPATVTTTFLSPFYSIDNFWYDLHGTYGASWNYTGSSSATTFASGGQVYTNVTAGMWLKSMYPDARRTLFVSGLPSGNYDVYVYYSCPSNVALASINGKAAIPGADPTQAGYWLNGAPVILSPNPMQAKYWYANVETMSVAAPADFNSALTSSVPPMAITNSLNNCIQINVGWPDVIDPLKDVKIIGLQILTHTNEQYSSPVLFAGAGNSSAYLIWHGSASATNYNIYRSINSTNTWTFLASTNQLQYHDTGITVGGTNYYYVVGVEASGILTTSGVVSVVPFGCAAPLPPRIDYVNQLAITPDSGTYPINYGTLLANSDALDPQGYHLIFKVDSVTSGSLNINGLPFSALNNNIDTGDSAVWTPPATLPSSDTTAFRVYVYDMVNRSVNTVDIKIKQTPKTYLYGWGNNTWGAVGVGTLDRVLGPYVFPLQEQSNDNLVPLDPRWRFGDSKYYGYIMQPQRVLDFSDVQSVSSDGYFSSGVGLDGQLWQWGGGSSAINFATRLVYASGDQGQYYVWVGGQPEPTGATGGEDPWRLFIPSPTRCQIPVGDQGFVETQLRNVGCQVPMTWGMLQPLADVKSVCGGVLYQIILKNDGTLWSWGDTWNGELGRVPQASDDLLLSSHGPSYGMKPGQIEIEGNNTNGLNPLYKFVDVQSSLGFTVARCQGGSIWAWGKFQGWLGDFDGDYEPESIWFNLGGDIDNPGLPNRVTSLDSDQGNPIVQMSISEEHLVIMRANGAVSELGYIPGLDADGGPGVDLGWRGTTEYSELAALYSSSPVPVIGLPGNISKICSGCSYGAALTASGDVWVWGHFDDANGVAPRQISSLNNIIKIAAGAQFILALDKAGRVWAIGQDDNAFGSDNSVHKLAVRIQGIENVKDIFAGGFGTAGIAFAIGTDEQGKPVSLTATPTNRAVRLSWTSYPNATTYVVYRSLNEQSGYVGIGTVAANSYLDQAPPLQNGQTYYYEVSAVVNGVETQPSWDTAATPSPPPTSVVNLTATSACYGVKLQWQLPTNAAASPVKEYVVQADGLQLVQLFPYTTNYYDDRPDISGSTIYTLTAVNSSGQASNSVGISATTNACDPPPFIRTNNTWLSVMPNDDGSDKATLAWAGPTNANSWLFQASEFDSFPGDASAGVLGTETLDGFVNQLLSAVTTDPTAQYLPAWLWSQFYPSETNILYAAPQTQSISDVIDTLAQADDDTIPKWLWQQFSIAQTNVLLAQTNSDRVKQLVLSQALLQTLSAIGLATEGQSTNAYVQLLYYQIINQYGNPSADEIHLKLSVLANALNRIITNGAIYTSGRFSGANLRSATTALRNSSPTGAALIQLNRMLLDDYFAAQFFTRGGNWGGGLTGFKIHYRTTQFFNNRKLQQNLQRDIDLTKLSYGLSAGYSDDQSVPCGVYRYSWSIPRGAVCWASVAAMVNGVESENSMETGPRQANSTDAWTASLRAIPGYQQVYLDWNDDDLISSFNIFYSTNFNATNDDFNGTWYSLPDSVDVPINRYWHTNLTSGNYHYKVNANFFDGTVSTNVYVSATVTAVSQPATNHFSADAFAYDGMVNVEWTIPTTNSFSLTNSFIQTSWQFYVERKLSGTDDSNYRVLTDPGFGLAYLDSDVVNGQAYTYRVTAFDLAFNRLQALAVAYNSTNTQITPLATNILTLLPPVPGNGYVNLAWSPIRANQFTIERSANPGGPFDVIDTLNVNSGYQNAKNTYLDTGLQNGIMYYYKITGLTPTGFQIESGVQGAMPLAVLTPLPPSGFRGIVNPVQGTNVVSLSWNPEPGISQYQVFLQNQSSMLPLYTGPATSYGYVIPDDLQLDSNVVFTFALRSINAQGLSSDLVTISVTNQDTTPSPTTAPPVLLLVAGTTNAVLAITGPTNITLSADVRVPNITQVSYYSDGVLIGTAADAPYNVTWYRVPGTRSGPAHQVFAVAQQEATVSSGAVYSSDLTSLSVNIEPLLSAYQTAATDLQLPAPALPISLSRSYSSRSTNANSVLGVGWSAGWSVGSVTLSAPLATGWNGIVQNFLGSQYYYIGESQPHFVTVTLPGGQTVGFVPEFPYNRAAGGELRSSDDVPFRFVTSEPGENELTADADSLEFNGSISDPGSDWATGVHFATFDPAKFTYVSPGGMSYTFGSHASGGLTWLLTQVTDRNGNSLNYIYDSSTFVLTSLSNSCGRSVTFNYVVPPTTPNNVTNIEIYDSQWPLKSSVPPVAPVVVYVVSNNMLTEVHQLVTRSSDGSAVKYQTNRYVYGSNTSAPADLSRLTDVFDARGIRVLHNVYTNSTVGPTDYTGDVAVQISPGRTNTFQIDSNFDLTLTTSSSTVTNTVMVNSDASGAISGATLPTDGTAPSSTNATQCAYDSQGNLINQTDANGNVRTYVYDDQNRLVGQSDENSTSTSLELNHFGQPTISTDANGKQTYYEYDNNGNPANMRDPAGVSTSYSYYPAVSDLLNNVFLGPMQASQSQKPPGVPYTVVTVSGYQSTGPILGDLVQTKEEWLDGKGFPVGTPVITLYQYDANGNRTNEIKRRTVNGTQYQYITNSSVYDAQNRIIATTVSAGGAEILAPQTTTVTYNSLGKQTTTTDAAGRVTTNIYDFNANLIETDYPDGTVSRTAFDSYGRQFYAQERAVPSSGVTTAPATHNIYDASGRVIRTEHCSGVQLTKTGAVNHVDFEAADSFEAQIKMTVSGAGTVVTTNLTFYDAVGRVLYSVDARGAVTQYQYDAAGRRTNVLAFTAYSFFQNGVGGPNPTGSFQNTSYTYDPNGNQLTVTDAVGHKTASVYDDANRVKEVDFPAANGVMSRFTYYDGLGRKLQEADEAGVWTAYSYDFRGLLTSVTLAYGTTQAVTTVYDYDELGNMIRQTDAAGHSITNRFDALGRRTGRTLPGGQSEGFAYDLAGNQIYLTNFNGVIITNQYDWASGRLTNCSSIGYQTAYAYSVTGLRTNMIDASGTNGYAYDSLNRLTNKTVAWAGGPRVSLSYGYDALGSLTNLWSSSANGVSNRYQYDLLGRLTNVVANGNNLASYGFDLIGNLQFLRYANGVTNLYQYDSRNRLTNLVWKLNAISVAGFGYSVAATGQRWSCAETVNYATPINQTYTWSYDYLYRLKSEGISSLGTVNYGFDAVGNRTNRTSAVSSLGTQTPAYTANDWLASDTYDANGNTTAFGTTNYHYDALNHLTNAHNGDVLLSYDGDGNRVKKVSAAGTTYYLVDDRNPAGYTQVLEEYQGASLVRVYNYGLGLASQRSVSDGTVNYYGTDGHGSTRFLMSIAGDISDTYTYDAYGILVARNGSRSNNYLYCGQQWDADLGMYYLRARYYKPDTGRFWTMDSYDGSTEDPLSMHKYLYCSGNPVDHFDLNGHDATLCSISFTMGIMMQQASYELKGAQSALEGARAMFGADETVNNIIYGLDVANVINDKVGAVALGVGATAGALAGSIKLYSWLRELSFSKQIIDYAVESMQNLGSAGVFIKYGKDAGKRCAFWAASFAHAVNGSIMSSRMIEDLSDGSLTAMESHFKGSFSAETYETWPAAKDAITSALTEKGPGSSAIVVGDFQSSNGSSHAFNVVNRGGKIELIDLSTGANADASVGLVLKNFKYMIVNY